MIIDADDIELWAQKVLRWPTSRKWKQVNSFPVIRGFAVRVTPIFSNKTHALNTWKMGCLLRINVMLP
jgi:hypothetical protein